MSEPIIMICCCKKYQAYLNAAIQRMERPEWRVVGIIGDLTLSEPVFDGKIVTLNVNDTYEFLPQKIQKGFEWCYKQWPDTAGIFKTDEDIVFDNINDLVDGIFKNLSEPYWGLHVDNSVEGHVNQTQINNRYIDKSLKPPIPTSKFCWGHGYWISKDTIPILIGKDADFEKYNIGSEDIYTGYKLNKSNIFPKHLPIKYKEVERNYLLVKPLKK